MWTVLSQHSQFFWGLLAKTFLVLILDPVRVGQGFNSPLVQCRSVGLSVVFEHVSPVFGARANFPKNLPLFWNCHPRAQFSQNSATIFGTFHEYKLWELSFCVSVIVNLPHATVAILKSP